MKTNCIIKTNNFDSVNNLLKKFFTKFNIEEESNWYFVTIYSDKNILEYFSKIFNGMEIGELFIGKSESIAGKHYNFNRLEVFINGLELFSNTICELRESVKLSVFTNFALYDLDTIVNNSFVEDCAIIGGVLLLYNLLDRDEHFNYKYKDLVNKIISLQDKDFVSDFCEFISYYAGIMYNKDFINKNKIIDELKYIFDVTKSFNIFLSFVDGMQEKYE